jgi:CheY-like chemotaxis protein
MGLSTVYGVVKQAGGHVRVLSRPGLGTRFELYFPLERGEVGQDAPGLDARTCSRGNERILLVEDDDQVRALARRVLEQHGYRVLEAAEAEAALRVAEEAPGPVHLLLTDVVLPRMSGFELAERLAGQLPSAAVLFVSAYREHPSLEARGLPRGARLLPKPFAPAELAAAVRETLDAPRGPTSPRP